MRLGSRHVLDDSLKGVVHSLLRTCYVLDPELFDVFRKVIESDGRSDLWLHSWMKSMGL